jgi:energy-coupling factor transport system permease protein
MTAQTRYAYRQGSTFMHRLDPISKMVWLFCLSFLIIILIITEVQLVLFSIILLTAFFLAGIRLGFIWRSLRYIYFLGTLIFLMQSLFVVGGAEIFQLGPFVIHETGLLIGSAAGLRIVNLATSSLIFLITTSPRDLAIASYEKLRLPNRATQALFLALRFMPLLEDEYADLMDAHRVRGAGAGNGLRERWKRFQRFTVPYLFSSLRRAQVTALAMDAKAFGAHPTKSFYHQVEYPFFGKVFAAVWIILLITGIVLVATNVLTRSGDLRMAWELGSMLV